MIKSSNITSTANGALPKDSLLGLGGHPVTIVHVSQGNADKAVD
jgi:hypothetical protein